MTPLCHLNLTNVETSKYSRHFFKTIFNHFLKQFETLFVFESFPKSYWKLLKFYSKKMDFFRNFQKPLASKPRDIRKCFKYKLYLNFNLQKYKNKYLALDDTLVPLPLKLHGDFEIFPPCFQKTI